MVAKNANLSEERCAMACKRRRLKEAMCILHLMDEQVDCSAYQSLLQVCLINRALLEAKLVCGHIIQSDFKFNCTDMALPNKLLSVYAKCGNLIDGHTRENALAKCGLLEYHDCILL